MLQYDEPSVVLISSVVWEYMAYSLIAVIFPWSWSRAHDSRIVKWLHVLGTAIIFSLLYVSILSLIEWIEFGRTYRFYNGWKFSLFHLPYVWTAYAIISFIIYYLPLPASKSVKYQHVKLTRYESKQLYTRIEELFLDQQYYLRASLKISDISKRLDVPVNKVSRAVNENFQGSFSDMVNQFRIGHAKKLLSDPANKDKLYAIALDSGFSNKV